MNVAVAQVMGAAPWQVVQSVGNPACEGTVLGLVKSAWWHE